MSLNPRGAGGHRVGQTTGVDLPSKDFGLYGFGLYFHIPFCTHKCPYCDFYTYPTKRVESATPFVDAVVRELARHDEFGWEKNRRVTSIFLGGGTPSWIPADEMGRILKSTHQTFSVDSNAEVTIEINPEDVTVEKAKQWKADGVNRASLGVQSLNDNELFRLERLHGAEGAKKSFDILRDAGFKNISLDLMFGLEQQSTAGWMDTLEQVVRWSPNHISAYNLTVEPKTRFAVDKKLDQLDLPDEETQIEIFLKTREFLTDAGLPPYEISNYAQAEFASQHNRNYWVGGEYWGLGPSAHSFQKLNGMFRRWWNVKSLNQYISKPTFEEEILFSEVHWGERLMTGLRMAEGVDLKEITEEIGPPTEATLMTLHRFETSGHLLRNGSQISLTEQGILVSNELFRSLIL